MYEYKCSNEECNQSWTIKEGGIGTQYLTCPHCQKGRGMFLRQIKTATMHEDIEKLALRKPHDDYKDSKEPENIEDTLKVEEKVSKKSKAKVEKPKDEIKEVKKEEKKSRQRINVKVNVSENDQMEMEEIEEDIFERIKKKRQREEEFLKNCDENVDVLEISGDTEEEVEKRIREFEEFYYIKVLEKDIQQQGKRYNCIVKYCRR